MNIFEDKSDNIIIVQQKKLINDKYRERQCVYLLYK